MIRLAVRKLLAAASMTALQVTAAHAQTASAGGAADAGAPGASEAAKAIPNEPRAEKLTEILVTAERRSESLQDVPYNISAVSAEELAKSGTTSINELAQVVPGLQYVDTGPNPRGGNSNFSMRGLRTDAPGGSAEEFLRSGSVAPVSTYYGETPIFFPLMIKDLDRVEVLKGPQGTLYGSGSLAGTIRLIPRRPSFEKFEGELNAEGGISEYSSPGNYSLDGVMNFPVSENVSVRVSGGYEHLGGFIDAVNLIQREEPGNVLSAPARRVPSDPMSGYAIAPIKPDANNSSQGFGRAAVRWRATQVIELELSYVHQRTHTDADQIANPPYPGGTYLFSAPSSVSITTGQALPDPTVNSVNTYRAGGKYRSTADSLTPTTSELDLGNLLITGDVGFATITSSTSGYGLRSEEETYYTPSTQLFNADGTLSFNYVPTIYANFPRFNYVNTTTQREHALVQELRLVSNGDGPFSYVLGGYYQHQHYEFENRTYVPGFSAYLTSMGLTQNNPQTRDLTYLYPRDHNGFQFRDSAVFGELSYKITPRWQVTGGIRFFWQQFRTLGEAYAFNGGAGFSISGIDPSGLSLLVDNTSKVSDHIGKVNTSFDVTPDLKVYATYSEGFRRGGANSINTAGAYASLPVYQQFSPDFAKNYEIGIKGALFGGRLVYTGDVFLIDLDNFQFNALTSAGNTAVFNGTTARSEGFEGEGELRITHELSMHVSYSYTDSKVRKGITYQDLAVGTLLGPPPPQIVDILTIPAGARLPGVSSNMANLGVDYTLATGQESFLSLHAGATYRSSQAGYIDTAAPYYWTIPAAFVANARIAYAFNRTITADLFVNNLTNDAAYSGGNYTQTVPTLFSGRYIARPRTYWVGVHYQF
jgi:outer membrane receptor protein involved in Fe transport